MKALLAVSAGALVIGLLLVVVSRLSDDAVSMAVGLLFGMLAGIPASLLTLYAVRQEAPAHTAPTPPFVIVIQPAGSNDNGRQMFVDSYALQRTAHDRQVEHHGILSTCAIQRGTEYDRWKSAEKPGSPAGGVIQCINDGQR